MEIRKVEADKKQYLDLLLLADEQEDMIDRYLEHGTMYVLEDGEVKAECVVTDEGGGVLELKNIAVKPDFQGKGYGKAIMRYLANLAVKEKCGRFEWVVLEWNQPAIGFYEKVGATVLPDWRLCRLTGEALERFAKGS